jgi:hypothetical protein
MEVNMICALQVEPTNMVHFLTVMLIIAVVIIIFLLVLIGLVVKDDVEFYRATKDITDRKDGSETPHQMFALNPEDFKLLDDDFKPYYELPDQKEAYKASKQNKSRLDKSEMKEHRQEVIYWIKSAIEEGETSVTVPKYIFDNDPELVSYLQDYKHYRVEHKLPDDRNYIVHID